MQTKSGWNNKIELTVNPGCVSCRGLRGGRGTEVV